MTKVYECSIICSISEASRVTGLSLLLSFLLSACHFKESYIDRSAPVGNPEIFEPNVISIQGRFERVPTFSPDGKEMFFTVTTPDWLPTIMVSKKVNGVWSEPATAAFSQKYNNTEPFFSPDGQQLFFASNRPPGSPPWNTNLWMAERADGSWFEPTLLSAKVNSDSSDYHPSVTENGTLFFASTRDTAQSGPDIYRSDFIDGEYQEAQRLDASINSEYQDWDPYVAPDESLMIFKSDRPGGFGDMDIYISFKKEDGSWTDAKNMGPSVNTKYHDDAGDLSLDGNVLFFARRIGESEMDIYWVDATFIQGLRSE